MTTPDHVSPPLLPPPAAAAVAFQLVGDLIWIAAGLAVILFVRGVARDRQARISSPVEHVVIRRA